jgi:hypothetical protein
MPKVSSIRYRDLGADAQAIIKAVKEEDNKFSYFRPNGYQGQCFTLLDNKISFHPPPVVLRPSIST